MSLVFLLLEQPGSGCFSARERERGGGEEGEERARIVFHGCIV